MQIVEEKESLPNGRQACPAANIKYTCPCGMLILSMGKFYYRKRRYNNNRKIDFKSLLIILYILALVSGALHSVERFVATLTPGLLILGIYIGWRVYKNAKKEQYGEEKSVPITVGAPENYETEAVPEKEKLEYTPYRKRDYLLTIGERGFYEVLQNIAEENNLLVFAKVRLEDLLWLPKYTNPFQKMRLRGYTRSRHIDFVLCDKTNIKPLIAIELNDSSHNEEERVERDQKIEIILGDAGLPLLWVKWQRIYNESEILRNIEALIKAE